MYLYGSWATERNRQTSDIDVGIIPRKRLPVELWWEIKDALDNSLVIQEVDLVDLSQTSAAFRNRVRGEGVLWSGSRKESPRVGDALLEAVELGAPRDAGNDRAFAVTHGG